MIAMPLIAQLTLRSLPVNVNDLGSIIVFLRLVVFSSSGGRASWPEILLRSTRACRARCTAATLRRCRVVA
jgi:hypothetical protein